MYCTLVRREVLGELVTDTEHITATGMADVEGPVTYVVTGGLIKEARLPPKN